MEYTIGQVVGIARTGSWDVMLEGKHTVTKLNKVRVELTGVDSERVRTFSIKTGRELGEFTSDRTYIITSDAFDSKVAMKQAELMRGEAFRKVSKLTEGMGHGRSAAHITVEALAELKAAVAALDAYAV